MKTKSMVRHCASRNEAMTDKETILLVAIKSMLETLKDHPCFDGEAFTTRDIDGLCVQGGDICTITMLAITAADAIDDAERLTQ